MQNTQKEERVWCWKCARRLPCEGCEERWHTEWHPAALSLAREFLAFWVTTPGSMLPRHSTYCCGNLLCAFLHPKFPLRGIALHEMKWFTTSATSHKKDNNKKRKKNNLHPWISTSTNPFIFCLFKKWWQL